MFTFMFIFLSSKKAVLSSCYNVVLVNARALRVGSIRAERNRLQLDPVTGAEKAVGTGDRNEVLDCGMVLGSIGYRCVPVDGIPYDERDSTIANEG